jgi:hypothetical protein
MGIPKRLILFSLVRTLLLPGHLADVGGAGCSRGFSSGERKEPNKTFLPLSRPEIQDCLGVTRV